MARVAKSRASQTAAQQQSLAWKQSSPWSLEQFQRAQRCHTKHKRRHLCSQQMRCICLLATRARSQQDAVVHLHSLPPPGPGRLTARVPILPNGHAACSEIFATGARARTLLQPPRPAEMSCLRKGRPRWPASCMGTDARRLADSELCSPQPSPLSRQDHEHPEPGEPSLLCWKGKAVLNCRCLASHESRHDSRDCAGRHERSSFSKCARHRPSAAVASCQVTRQAPHAPRSRLGSMTTPRACGVGVPRPLLVLLRTGRACGCVSRDAMRAQSARC